MNNQALHPVDPQGKSMLGIFDAQCNINTILSSNILSPASVSIFNNEHLELSNNYIDLDTSVDLIEGSDMYSARIFPKKKSMISSDVAKDLKKYEKTLFEISAKIFTLGLFWTTKLFQNLLHSLTTLDAVIEEYVVATVSPQTEVRGVIDVDEQKVVQPTMNVRKNKVYAVPVQEYRVRHENVIIKHIPLSQKNGYALQQRQVQRQVSVQTPAQQICIPQRKKRSTVVQVLAILTAEILYGKQLSNIDSI
jgi:hypothetical protein